MRRRRSSSPTLLIYLITFILIVCFLAFVGYRELKSFIEEPPVVFDDPEMEPFDSSSFDLHLLPPDTDHSQSTTNPLPVSTPLIFPLSRLKTGHHTQIYDLVIVNQVGIDEIDPENGYTLLHYLARSYNLLALRFLLNNKTYGEDGVNSQANYRSGGGDTPLHLAVTHPNLILALFLTNLLIEHNANPDIANTKGLTARDLAKQSHVDERILKVIEGEYDPRSEFESESKTFLDFAFGSSGPPKDPFIFK